MVLYEGRVNQIFKSKLQGTSEWGWIIHFIACDCRLFRWLSHCCGQTVLFLKTQQWPLQTHQPKPRSLHMGATQIGEEENRRGRKRATKSHFFFWVSSRAALILQWTISPAIHTFYLILAQQPKEGTRGEYVGTKWPKRKDSVSPVPSACVYPMWSKPRCHLHLFAIHLFS